MKTIRYYNLYKEADCIVKIAEWMMFASAIIFLLNAFYPTVCRWDKWHYILNLNNIILIIVNALLVLVSWLNYTARGNKLAGCLDNAYNTVLAIEPPKSGYYDNDNVEDQDLKFALNVYESCFFSSTILSKQATKIIIKNLVIAILFLTAIVLEKSQFLMSILGLFIVIHYLRKLFVFMVVKHSLSETCNMFQTIFNSYKNGQELDFQAVILNASNYETAMVWLGTVLSNKIYSQCNTELTNEWMVKQQQIMRQ